MNLTTVHDGFRSWNNAYCQDNELTWFDWARADRGLLKFTRRVIALRKAHPVFRRRRFLAGPDVAGQAGDKLTVGPRSITILRSPRRRA